MHKAATNPKVDLIKFNASSNKTLLKQDDYRDVIDVLNGKKTSYDAMQNVKINLNSNGFV